MLHVIKDTVIEFRVYKRKIKTTARTRIHLPSFVGNIEKDLIKNLNQKPFPYTILNRMKFSLYKVGRLYLK